MVDCKSLTSLLALTSFTLCIRLALHVLGSPVKANSLDEQVLNVIEGEVFRDDVLVKLLNDSLDLLDNVLEGVLLCRLALEPQACEHVNLEK